MKSYIANDLYKISMGQLVWQKHPNAHVKYHFKCRSKGVNLLPFRSRIEEKIHDLHGLCPLQKEVAFLEKQGYFNKSYLAAYSHKKFNTKYVKVSEVNGELDIAIEGPWYDTIDFEVPILGAVNEAYFEQYNKEECWVVGDRRLTAKIERLCQIREEEEKHPERNPFKLMEFGTRRAFSREWQDHMVGRLKAELPSGMLSGCSNVALAMKHDLVPQGTMAHEVMMAYQAFYPLHEAQSRLLYDWNDVYHGRLGIALSDTVTFDQFLRDFDLALAKLYDGARHDSGDPFKWGEKLIAHYTNLGINAFFKIGAWTDGLDIDLSYLLWERFSEFIRTSFGIGTFLSNDCGPKPLAIVIKMTHCNGLPLIKISDEPSKAMCEDPEFKAWAIKYFTEIAPELTK